MAHTIEGKDKLIARIRRIRGQVNAIEEALASEHDCSAILQTVASCRGALNGLMAELIEGHVREHVVPKKKTSSEAQAAEALIEVINTYLK